jgi:hypothetical protein
MATPFTCFPKLPKEIQFKIWKEAAFETRNVGVWVLQVDFGDFHNQVGDQDPYYFGTNVGPPAILHTCKESRSEGLKYYQLSLGTVFEVEERARHAPFTVTFPPRTYINWSSDRICIMLPWFEGDYQGHLELLSQAENNNLKLIAFNTLRSTSRYSNIDRLIKHAVHAFRPVELTLFDLSDLLDILRSPFTFDVDHTESRNMEWTRLHLVKSIKGHKITEVGKGAGAVDAEGGVDGQLEIHHCRVLCDGEPKE